MKNITLLLDLDDTLLDTNMQAFIPAYFSALSTAVSAIVSPDIMLPALTGGTKAMMENQDPAHSLREVFEAHFFPRLGVDRKNLADTIDQFYDETFPSLAYVASQRPEAIEFVRWAFGEGYRVAVATNPYFPLKAVHHRMRWAGLAPEEHDFALVSSFETFHFTKETPAYFLELLAQLGWEDSTVVMVGNDLEMDLLPARRAGLPIFWLREGKDESQPGIPQGNFKELRAWLEAVELESIKPVFDTSEAIENLLRSTPAALGSLTRDLPAEAWECRPAEGEWCLTEVFCHLRDVETDIYLPRIEKITSEENPFLAGVNSDDWVKERKYATQDGREALRGFLEARKQTLEQLTRENINWNAPARHAIFGRTTLLELAGFMAGHDRAHVQQVWKTIHG